MGWNWSWIAMLAVVLLSGCQSEETKDSKPKPWPQRAQEVRTEQIGDVTVRLSLPEGVGAYTDPNGMIWRDVGPSYSFFIKVFATPPPASLAEALDDALLEEGEPITTEERADGYAVSVAKTPEQHERFYRWVHKNGQGVSCHVFFTEKGASEELIEQSGPWLRSICESIEIVSPE